MGFEDTLADICRRHVLRPALGAVVPEPCIPYLPSRWNKTLVLAEAQNLGKRSAAYVARLKAMSPTDRIRRLGMNGRVGVEPWDDGSLKLAVQAALRIDAAETAVSNAVLWSQVDRRGRNQNPSDTLVDRSFEVWAELLPVLKPERIVTAGKVADRVITAALNDSGLHPERIVLRLPSPQAMSRISGMFREADLLQRYPEVDAVVREHPDWVIKQRRNKVFFAYHAVSLFSRKAG
jgi:hypothetical protein